MEREKMVESEEKIPRSEAGAEEKATPVMLTVKIGYYFDFGEEAREKMEDSGAILCQISVYKDMLDQVNSQIEANVQVTREIESKIGKCSEIESALFIKESELTRSFLTSQFEISGLISVTDDSRNSLKLLEDEICGLTNEHTELLRKLKEKREGFVKRCIEFQREIGVDEDSELRSILLEKEFLENEVGMLEQKNIDVKNSILAYMEDEMKNLLSL